MTSQPGYQANVMRMLHNILRSKGNDIWSVNRI